MTSPTHTSIGAPRTSRLLWGQRLGKEALRRAFARLQGGRVTLRDGHSEEHFGSGGPLHATLTVHHPDFYQRVLRGGTIGAAETYADGTWDCHPLPNLVRLMVRNEEITDRLERGFAAFANRVRYLSHRWFARNTKIGSRKNIAAHYDLGNDWFRLFLDRSLTYSSAIFPSAQTTLEEASTAKLDRICQKLALTADDHLLEIGTGWGSFALHAAARYGCRVTTTTISKEQHYLATERVRDAGLSDRITVLLSDYRDLEGQFDKAVSVEMIEAVGHENLPEYFRTVSRLLKPGGVFMVQGITLTERRHARALKNVDFIQSSIFPGSSIPSVGSMLAAARRATDFVLADLAEFGSHYARTLAEWRTNLRAATDRALAQGFPRRMLRQWEFYFAYCEGGFAEGQLGLVQALFARGGFTAATCPAPGYGGGS